MPGTITGTHTSTVTLAVNPSVVTTTATIDVASGIGLTGTSTTAWVLTNYGSIFGGGGAGAGVFFTGGGTITNKSGGTVKAGHIAVDITGAAANVANYGVIDGTNNGVDLTGSTVNSGTVVSTVTNSASISGDNGSGVVLRSGGTIQNNAAGVIKGGANGVVVYYGAVTNAGHIVGTQGQGVVLTGSAITNLAGATISGGTVGVYGHQNSGTVINAGTIAAGAATDFAVHLRFGYFNTVEVFAGASFVGTVSGGNTPGSAAYSILELGSSTVTGTLSGLGSSFVGFTQITVDAGAVWTLKSDVGTGYTVTDSGTLTNTGTLNNPGTLNNGSPASGASLLSGAMLINDRGATIAGDYGVTGNGGTLVNAGYIGSTVGDGVKLKGGTVIDQGAGTISGLAVAVYLAQGGSATVESGGTLDGGASGIFVNSGAGSVTNDGYVAASVDAVDFQLGGTVNNQSEGMLTGGAFGIVINSAVGSVSNAGTIYGGIGLSSGSYGIQLGLGGTVGNSINGVISGGGAGIIVTGAAALVVTDGYIGGTSAGIELNHGGAVSNQSDGLVSSSGTAIVVAAAAGTITNAGILNGGNYGVDLTDGGTVTNQSGGSISSSGVAAVAIAHAAGSVVNDGYISANKNAISISSGGVVSNQNSAVISAGALGIVFSTAAGTVVNAGTIKAGGLNGVRLGGGGTVSNASTGVISSSNIAILISGAAGTVLNAGSISGSGGAVRFASGFANLLTMGPGAAFDGTVDGHNGIGGAVHSTMELASGGTAVGTLSGIGSQYLGFARINVDAGAAWHLTGNNLLAAGVTLTNDAVLVINNATVNGNGAVVNDALLVIDPSTVDLAAITGSGTIAIGAFSTVDLKGAVAIGQTIKLDGTPDLLVLGDPAQFSGTIDGFAPADTIQLTGITDVSSANVISGNVLRIVESGGATLDLQLGQSYGNPTFKHAVVGGDTNIQVPCFLAGTRIATPTGERAIETLRIGDLVLTRHGEARRIKWIGRRGYTAAEARASTPLRPILIVPGTFSDNLPRRTLAVSSMHALVIDGLFIPAAALVNGVSIRRSEAPGPLLYLHLEFEAHEVVLAEGAAAESFLDEHSRDLFDNAAEYFSLYGNPEPSPRRAPRTEHGYALEVVRRRLAARAGICRNGGAPGRLLGHVERLAGGNAEGWVLNEADPTMPVELEAWHGGVWLGRVLANRYRTDLDRAGLAGGRCAFHLPLPSGAALTRLAMRRASDGVAVPIQA